jgi:hypothetical protein
MGGIPPMLTDSDVDALASGFLNSSYVGPTYANWPIDRRLDKFLRRSDLTRIADDGDLVNLVLERIMAHKTTVGSSRSR